MVKKIKDWFARKWKAYWAWDKRTSNKLDEWADKHWD